MKARSIRTQWLSCYVEFVIHGMFCLRLLRYLMFFTQQVSFVLNDICLCTLARTVLLPYMLYKGEIKEKNVKCSLFDWNISFNRSLNAGRLANNIEKSCCLKHKQMTAFVYSCPLILEPSLFTTCALQKIISVARCSFLGSIPPKFEHKLRRHKQMFGKMATTVVLDKDDNML